MKIACATNTPLDASLGSGKTVIEWSSGLRRLGHEVVVFAPDDFFRPFPGGILRRLKMRWDAFGLERRLRNGGFDLIEFYGAEFGWLTARLSARFPRPLLVAHTNGLELLARERQETSASSIWGRIAKWPVEALIKRCDVLAFSKADRFAAICDLDARYIISHGIKSEEHTVVVEPGIDAEYVCANWDQPKSHCIAYLGSYSERKDTVTLVAVSRRLLEEDPQLRFDLMGAWNAKDEIMRSFPSLLHSRIQVHPRLGKPAIAEMLARAKVFLFPSLYEGFGMATAEAMACGCAAVVTPTGFGGALSDRVEALVRPFRDVDGLTDAVRLLLSKEPMRRRIARAGRERVADMTWSNQVKQLEATYLKWCQAT